MRSVSRARARSITQNALLQILSPRAFRPTEQRFPPFRFCVRRTMNTRWPSKTHTPRHVGIWFRFHAPAMNARRIQYVVVEIRTRSTSLKKKEELSELRDTLNADAVDESPVTEKSTGNIGSGSFFFFFSWTLTFSLLVKKKKWNEMGYLTLSQRNSGKVKERRGENAESAGRKRRSNSILCDPPLRSSFVSYFASFLSIYISLYVRWYLSPLKSIPLSVFEQHKKSKGTATG